LKVKDKTFSDVIFFWNRKLIFYLKDNEAIYDYDNILMGVIKDFKIYDNEGTLLHKYKKDSGEILLRLKGSLCVIDHITLVGIIFSFMDLFC